MYLDSHSFLITTRINPTWKIELHLLKFFTVYKRISFIMDVSKDAMFLLTMWSYGL